VTRASGPGEPGARSIEGIDDQRLRWYPRQWRARYGDELAALLDEEYGHHLPVSARFGLVTGGLRQRARASGLGGDSVPAPERVRSGALVVLAAWIAFVVAGANFAKFSEHFDEALPHAMGTHRLPDLAFLVLQTTAGVASFLVVAGALLALPAFVRFLRADGWTLLRGHLLRALGATALTVAVTAPLLMWAHRLTSQQRNGGLHWYGALYLMWAALIVITLTLWTVVAIAAARRVHLSKRMLAAESVLAVAVALAMVVMIAATAAWWGAMAHDAPAFLSARPAGSPASPWDSLLIATVAVMGLAIGVAAVGVTQEVRGWLRMRAG